MPNTVLIKRSGTANAVPLSANLTEGELAINYTDGNLFYKNNVGTTTLLVSNQFVSVSGNVTGGNVLTAGLISATGNVTGGNILGGANVNATTHTGTTVSVTGNIDGGNLRTAGLVSATGNVTGGNVLTAGLISATGNITANVFNGNGSALTGIQTGPKAITIYNPSSSEDLTVFFARNAMTIVAVNSVVTGTTPSVTYSLQSGADRSVITTTHVSANVVTSTTTGNVVIPTNTTIAANTWIWLTTSATSGTVNSFNITISV